MWICNICFLNIDVILFDFFPDILQLCFLYHGEHCSKKLSKIPSVATNVNDNKESLTDPILLCFTFKKHRIYLFMSCIWLLKLDQSLYHLFELYISSVFLFDNIICRIFLETLSLIMFHVVHFIYISGLWNGYRYWWVIILLFFLFKSTFLMLLTNYNFSSYSSFSIFYFVVFISFNDKLIWVFSGLWNGCQYWW